MPEKPLFLYEKMHDSTDTQVRFPSTLVAGRIVHWPDAAYFVANSGVTFEADELEALAAKLKEFHPVS